jgi:hypothetical protein
LARARTLNWSTDKINVMEKAFEVAYSQYKRSVCTCEAE